MDSPLSTPMPYVFIPATEHVKLLQKIQQLEKALSELSTNEMILITNYNDQRFANFINPASWFHVVGNFPVILKGTEITKKIEELEKELRIKIREADDAILKARNSKIDHTTKPSLFEILKRRLP